MQKIEYYPVFFFQLVESLQLALFALSLCYLLNLF